MELTAGEAHRGLAVAVERGGDCDGTRPRGGRLPHAALPYPGRQPTGAFGASDLDVRPAGKARVRLEQRAEQEHVPRVALHDRMRIPDVDGHDRDAGDALALVNEHATDMRLDELAAQHARLDEPLADTDADRRRAGSLGDPPGGDASAVARELRRRA